MIFSLLHELITSSSIDSKYQHTNVLKGHLETSFKSYQTKKPVIPDETHNEIYMEPLRREEIGKLLLLVSKAFETQQISRDQKSKIKNQICNRAGYLRLILEQEDMRIIMAALVTIGDSASD